MELPEILSIARELRAESDVPGGRRLHRRARQPGRARGCASSASGSSSETRVYRKTGRPFFIDKMPNNFLHVGMIHLVLPNAKIIDARRHPLACCFSNYRQHFATRPALYL